MSVAAGVQLFESPGIVKKVRSQLRSVRGINFDVETTLEKIRDDFKDKYNVNRISVSGSELSIKVDKKKQIVQVEEDVKSYLKSLVSGTLIDVDFLFKITRSNNELIIRIKKYNG